MRFLKDQAILYLSYFLSTSLSSLLLRAVFRKSVFVITTHPTALLGNQLTIFTHVIACALETGREVWCPSFFKYAKYFEVTRHDLFTRFPERKSLLFGSQRARNFVYYYLFARVARVLVLNPQRPAKDVAVVTDYEHKQSLESAEFLSQISAKRVVLIEGYHFRNSLQRVKTHSVVIKKYFTPLRSHEAKALAVIRQARMAADVLVGVHLRQYDPAYDSNNPFYRFQHVEQMNQAMHQTAGLFPGKKVVFLLFSNRTVDHGMFAEFSTAEGTGHIAEDLHALSRCDYILASTYSSYSRWASFYGNVPLYQMDDPEHRLSLQDFQVQVPGIFDPSNESSPVRV